ncbi:hypothetical protein [Micromonospora sp. WMMD1082]|uniref:hypothetical protein n=1 Tax=Micromonospora sp. WMMD1082 TaxID=3016104 RepID=UPI002417D498|nr:hypothetical protein [Micromonospora sp. WMMD1082]MDG4793604.1 hypothetical protein [Micromonospora sp. WMMD1082]
MASEGTAALEAMIGEATVDAYGDDEQLTGLFTMIEEHSVPEATTGKRSISSTCRYPPPHRTAPRGSTPTGTGLGGRPR